MTPPPSYSPRITAFHIRRGPAGEPLAVADHRGPGGPDRGLHGPVRHRAASHVRGDAAAVSVHAPGAGLHPRFPGLFVLPRYHRQAHPERGAGAVEGPSRLPGILRARSMAFNSLYLVKNPVC